MENQQKQERCTVILLKDNDRLELYSVDGYEISKMIYYWNYKNKNKYTAKYEGEFKNYVIDGQGTFTIDDYVYTGNFKNGQFGDKVTKKCENGVREVLEFKDGELINKTAYNTDGQILYQSTDFSVSPNPYYVEFVQDLFRRARSNSKYLSSLSNEIDPQNINNNQSTNNTKSVSQREQQSI